MKRLFLFLIIICAIFSCQNEDDIYFDASFDGVELTFEPITGGAIMKYKLPAKSDIYAVQATYKDYKGEEMTVKGTYLSNEIILSGFIDDEASVPVKITLVDNKGNASKSIDRSFSTSKSAAKAFFDDLEVKPYWSGFFVKYKAPEITDGFVHIAYIGTNYMTKELDTLLIKTFPIESGEIVKRFPDICNRETQTTTVVVWTEDFRGNIVEKKIYNDIPAAMDELIDPSNFDFNGSSVERPEWKIGWKYLFDGDTKGETMVHNGANSVCYSFISNPYAVPGFFSIDLQEERELSRFKLYAALNNDIEWHWDYWGNVPGALLPNHVKVYASNDPYQPIEEWDYMGEYFESVNTPEQDRWMYPMIDPAKVFKKVSDIEKEDAAFMQINFDITGKKYRYLRFEVLEVYQGEYWGYFKANEDLKVSFHEVEVYGKVDDN